MAPRQVRSGVRAAGAALLALSLVALATASAARTHTVTIENMQFSPSELTVQRGDTIVWVNKDLFPHTATSDKTFDSGSIAANASWSYVAARSGEYAYGCTFHPTMKGKIIVK